MASDASNRGLANSITAANEHPAPPTNNDGSISTQQSKESRSKGALEIHVESESYEVEAQNTKSAGSPSPRNQPAFRSNTIERRSRPGTKDYSPMPAEISSRQSHANYAPNQGSGITRPNQTSHISGPVDWSSRPAKEAAQSVEPPVTKGTLSELDVTKIVNNPKLRHDINFDPELHFRPNLDGEKGRKKTDKANRFWDMMRGQLQDFLTGREQFERELGDSDWCLPATLNAIRGILETLVPQRDKASVEETFNVDLLMQQFRMGVADLVKLALWLSQLLKNHCAPMRDNWVDDMVMQLSSGDKNGDVNLLVAGMKNLLGVLEAMKLDVANHQIRCLRPLLIDDTVHFEQKFFMKKIAMRRVDIAGAHAWFKQASNSAVTEGTGMHSQTMIFIQALVQLTLPSKSELFPHTFLFDEERLIKLRADMLDMINLEICMQLYRTESQSRSYLAKDDTPTSSYASSPFDRPGSPAINLNPSSPTVPSIHHFDASKPSRQEHGHFIRHPSGRQVWVPKLDHSTSAASSPQSSPSSTASTPDTFPPTPFSLNSASSDSAAQLRTALLAILASSTASKRWSAVSADLALQILRSTPQDLSRLPQFEKKLAFHLSNPGSKQYQDAEGRILAQLNEHLTKLVDTYTPLTSLQMFEAATSKTTPPGVPARTNGFKEEITELATRIAHIGILHWRVWAPLAYLVDPDAEEEITSHSERAKSMP